MDEWVPIGGLTAQAESYFSESWAMVKYLLDNPGLDVGVVENLVAELFRVECRISDLREAGLLFE